MWNMCKGFEGTIFCNNGKVVKSSWENSGYVINAFLSYLQILSCIKESAPSP